MKKWLIFMLATLLLLGACSNTVTDESSSSEENSGEENVGGPYETLVSVGKPYTTSVKPNDT